MPAKKETVGTAFFVVLGVATVAVIAGYLSFEYDLKHSKEVDSSSIYNFYVGVALMMFVGFGYLMTFLKSYGLGAVGFTMYITCLGVAYAVLVEQIMCFELKSINLMALLNGNFAVAAVLISFGALIGKVGPLQCTILVLMEIQFYCFNKVFVLAPGDALEVRDVGGTIVIHVFGAYFGLACSKALGPPKDENLNASNYVSDLFSLVGTVFLWLYWPSFVAGAMPAGKPQNAALINTILALLSSTVVTFLLTPLFAKDDAGTRLWRLATVPIQNATLAGGVSIGATANCMMSPGVAMIIGSVAGAISTIGFCSPCISSATDTCGINNLHGMPGIFGGLVSVPMTVLYGMNTEHKKEHHADMHHYVIHGMWAVYQFGGLVWTLIFSSITGWITGKVLKCVGSAEDSYTDEAYWDTADDIKTE